MAKLVLTEEEKAATSWLDLDDESLGKLCRATCAQLMVSKDDPEDRRRIWASATVFMLCNVVHDSNAEACTFKVENLRLGDHQRGNWEVSVKRIATESEVAA